MPFAPISNPDLAGEFMARGIGQAGTGIAAGLQRALEGQQAKSKERKTYLGLAEALNSQGILDDHTKAALQNADTDTLKGTLDGLITANTLKHVGYNNDLLKQHIDQADTERTQVAGLNEDLSAALEPPAEGEEGPANALSSEMLTRAAARHGLVGNPRMDQFMTALERVEAHRANKADLSAKPEFQDVPGTDSVLARLGKTIQIVPKTTAGFQPAIDADTGEPIPGAYNFGGRIVQVPQANLASQQKLGMETELEARKLLQQLNQQIDVHSNQTQLYEESQKPTSWWSKKPDLVPKPDPNRLQGLLKQKARVEAMLDASSSPATAAPAAQRSTEIEPPVGTIKVGKGNVKYRYIGGYGTLDKRSWQPVP